MIQTIINTLIFLLYVFAFDTIKSGEMRILVSFLLISFTNIEFILMTFLRQMHISSVSTHLLIQKLHQKESKMSDEDLHEAESSFSDLLSQYKKAQNSQLWWSLFCSAISLYFLLREIGIFPRVN